MEAAAPNYDLSAEALVLISGLFPDRLTAADGRQARDLPREWYRRVCDFMRSKRPARFRMFSQPDPERTYLRLRKPIDVDAVAGDIDDAGLVSAYADKLEEARRYVTEMWPVLHIETFLGPEYVQPSLTALGEAYSIMALCGQRDRFVDELAAGTLTSAQAEAFQALFPGLWAMVQEFLSYERGRMIRAQEPPAYWVESTLRTLLGMGPDPRALTSPADEAPSLPPPEMPTIDVDFSSYRTRAQRADDPGA